MSVVLMPGGLPVPSFPGLSSLPGTERGGTRPTPTAAAAAAAAATGLRRDPLRALEPAGASRGTGLAVVVGLHLLLAWVFGSGLGHQAVELVKKPIQLALISEVPPPPPPPPPKVELPKELPKPQQAVTPPPPPPAYVPPPEVLPAAPAPAPVITQVQQAEPPKAAPVVAGAPAPAPAPAPVPAPAPPPVVVKQEVSVACPGYQAVLAQTLEDVFDRVGIPGTVRMRLTVHGNQVAEAVPVSGPREYLKYVQAAVKRMKCSAGGADDVQVLLDVQFKG